MKIAAVEQGGFTATNHNEAFWRIHSARFPIAQAARLKRENGKPGRGKLNPLDLRFKALWPQPTP